MKYDRIFETNVVEIGKEAQDFGEIGMAILFGSEAPDALRSSCYIINVKPVLKEIKNNMVLKIDGNKYRITAVGNEVQTNLSNLGHIAISFTGATEAKLPGTMYVEEKKYPKFKINTEITIEG